MVDLLTEQEFLVVQEADKAVQHQLYRILNNKGLARWTVCPICHVDDFVHVEGCRLDNPD